MSQAGSILIWDHNLLDKIDQKKTLRQIRVADYETVIPDAAFQNFEALVKIELPPSVRSIGRGAFKGCTSLASVAIPSSVASIGVYAFEGCSALASLEIPSSVTSIGHAAFYECSSLASIELPPSVRSIGLGAFQGCSSLASIAIPPSVTTIGVLTFYGCTSLTSLTIPNSVRSIDRNAFHKCESLTSLVIPPTVNQIADRAFEGCKSLRIVVLPDTLLKVGGVGGKIFINCPSVAYCIIVPSDADFGATVSAGARINLGLPATCKLWATDAVVGKLDGFQECRTVEALKRKKLHVTTKDIEGILYPLTVPLVYVDHATRHHDFAFMLSAFRFGRGKKLELPPELLMLIRELTVSWEPGPLRDALLALLKSAKYKEYLSRPN